MTDKDISLVGMHPPNHNFATEAEASGIAKSSSSRSRSPRAGSGDRSQAGIQEKLAQSKPKHIDADGEDNDDWPATSQSQSPTMVNQGRISILQGCAIQEENSSTSGSSSQQGTGRALSESGGDSIASSGESKAAHLSGRSPTRLSPFNNIVLGNNEQKKENPGEMGSETSKENLYQVKELKGKPTTSSPAKAVKEKSTTASQAKAVKEKSLDDTRLEALHLFDSELTILKPPEVKILLLENMSEADVLATFEGYKSDFDKLFEERQNEPETHSYMNVDNIDVMDILNVCIRYEMMMKLGESYYTRSSHTSLIMNGLLPLWIVLLFTDTYNLSHDDAARQIKDQVGWINYLKALNDDPFDSDPDD